MRVLFVAGEIGGYPAAVAWEPGRSMNFGMNGHACFKKSMNQRYMLVPGGGVPGTQEPPLGPALSCTVSEIWPSIAEISLYLATPLVFKPRQRGSSGTISVKISVDVRGWPRYQMAYKKCRKF